MTLPNNPPAFPALNFIVPSDLEARHVHRLGEVQGMTLRDYFAAQVVGAYIYERFSGNHTWEPHEIAEWSYDMADAMLIAREGK